MMKRPEMHELSGPRLLMKNSFAWPEHRDGWAYVESIFSDTMCCADGTVFVSSIEEQLYTIGPIKEDWVGIVHQVPRHGLTRYPDLQRLIAREDFVQSLPFCKGLWTLCDYTRRWLIEHEIRVPICVLPYVTPKDVRPFAWDEFVASEPRRLLHIGQYLRRFQSFYDLQVPSWQKLLLIPPKWEIRAAGVEKNSSVTEVERVDNSQYDELLGSCVVFLDLEDAPANTIVVECMARATPICVNQVGGIAEYLGIEYPLYHNGDAAKLLGDDGRLKAAHSYLVERRSSLPDADELRKRVQSGAVYLSLPVPPSIQTEFRQFEATLLVAVYARLEHLPEQLRRFAEQEDPPSFELVLWNNNPENAENLARIVAEFRDRMPIRIINSSDNIYCSMRMAVPAFARSKTLMICDDDVVPEPTYLRVLFDAWRRHGEDAVICVRGHVIHPHALDLDNPDQAWITEKDMTFYDEAAPECMVHFAHADNLVISTDLLRRASRFEPTHPEYVLVDDYWLSYVLNARLGISIHKVQAPEILRFTDSANDPDVALYHNPKVHQQRVRLYVEHMLAGWPHPPSMVSSTA